MAEPLLWTLVLCRWVFSRGGYDLMVNGRSVVVDVRIFAVGYVSRM
jgi:hypothetical protein